MTANVPARTAAPKPNVSAGGHVAALVPQNLDQAFRLASAIAGSGMAPRGMDKPEQVMVAILAGAEIGFAPYQAMQSFAIVNNRPTLWGDAIPALLWSHGFKVREWFDDDDAPTRAFCEITRPDGTVIERRYSLEDAKAAGLLSKQGPWQSYRARMLQMRARAFCARDGAADVLKGLAVREEVEDYASARDTRRAEGTGMRERLAAREPQPDGGFDPDHVADAIDAAIDGDAVPDFDQRPDDERPPQVEPEPEPAAALEMADADFDAEGWAATFNREIGHMHTVDAVSEAWDMAKTSGRLFKLRVANPGMAASLVQAVNERVAEIKAELTA